MFYDGRENSVLNGRAEKYNPCVVERCAFAYLNKLSRLFKGEFTPTTVK